MSPHNDVAAPVRWRRRTRPLASAALAALIVFSGVAGGVAPAGAKVRTLKMGSRGAAVKKLQRRLHVRPVSGYYGSQTKRAVKRFQRRLHVRPVSGYYGSKTKRAVKRFQRRHHLRANGIAGPATLRALHMGVHSASSSHGGATAGSGGSAPRIPAQLRRIAKCESGGNPRAVSPSGRYRGKYQFDQATWEAWGGHGDPIDSSESVQDRVALRLYRARGTAPWPNCA